MTNTKSKKVTISFRTDSKTKHEAQKVAKHLGLSLSAILNMFFEQLIHDKRVADSIRAQLVND